jgi:hypothetical protein
MSSNPWTDFLDLMPSNSRWVGIVKGVHGVGSVFVDLPNSTGDNIVVNGDISAYPINSCVFIEGNTIVAKTANLKMPIGDGKVT